MSTELCKYLQEDAKRSGKANPSILYFPTKKGAELFFILHSKNKMDYLTNIKRWQVVSRKKEDY
jgi:hypothetical protein